MVKKERWFFGGFAACTGTVATHPLDTIKVHLQTSQTKGGGVFSTGRNIVREGGFLALYNGLSASLCRQFFYTGARFAIYNAIRNKLTEGGRQQSSIEKAGSAAFCGVIGGFIGTPWDIINVRMQNDIKLPPDKRRNYKWAGDGLIRILREEGLTTCFKGASFVMMRGSMMTVGQLAFYDIIKTKLLETPYFENDMFTYFISSTLSAMIATVLTQPFDVVKTRMMQAKPGELKGYMHCIVITAKGGPLAFFKGIVPASIRLVPGNIILYTILEQLVEHFGIEEA